MKHLCKRISSFLLALCMMFSLVPAGAWAGNAYTEGESYFDFDAADYSVQEDNQTLRVKIVRYGEGTTPANVAVKVADFLSTYGEDYEVFLDGEAFSMQEGTVISPSDFTFDDSEDQTGGASGAPAKAGDAAQAEETVEAVETEEVEETVEAVEAAEAFDADDAEELAADDADEADEADEAEAEEVETLKRSASGAAAVDLFSYRAGGEEELVEEAVSVEDAADADEADEAAAEEADTSAAAETAVETAAAALQSEAPAKQSKSASPLRDAQAAWLNLPESSSAELMEENAPAMFENLHEFFENARGAMGIVYFGAGVRERVLTVRTKDNDEADGSRMFLIGLLGTDTEETTIAPNATTYVTIEDDDEYEPATFSIVDSEILLTRDAPSAQITITRTGGTQYFGTAYVSTVTGTAKASAYKAMDKKSVGFIPGQTEAQVTVSALDFTQGGMFGIRLESDPLDSVDRHYIDVKIAADETAELSGLDEDSDPYGLGIAYEIASPEEAEAYYGAAAANLIPVSINSETGALEVIGAQRDPEKADVMEPAPKADAEDAAEVQDADTAELMDGSMNAPTSAGANTTTSIAVNGTTVQYITFRPSVSGVYRFESTNSGNSSSFDPYGYLYASNKSTELASNDDGAGSRNFLIEYELTANTTYYVGVKFYYSDNRGNINVRATLVRANQTEMTLSQPNAGASVTAAASVETGGQVVYLRFTPTAAGRYVFESTSTSASSSDTYGYLYASNKSTQLASNDDGGEGLNFRIEYDLAANTTYYFAAKFYSSGYTGTINVRLSRPGPTPTPTPAATATPTPTAAPLADVTLANPTASSPVSGSVNIRAGGQIGYLRFTPSTTGMYLFKSTNTDGDPYAYLYAADKTTQLAYNDDGAGNRNFQIPYTLTANTTYYFAAKFYSASETGTINYQLSLVSPVYLGQASMSWSNCSTYPGGWGTETTGSDSDNRASVGDNLYVAQYDEDRHSLVYSRNTWNFTGIYNIHFSMCAGGDGNNHFTVFETDSDQSWPGSTRSYRQNGQSGWAERDLNVGTLTGNHYLKFGAEATDWGRQNPKSTLDWFTFQYTRYSLSLMTSCENFNRMLYDFTENTLEPTDIYYEGATQKVYTPGALQALSGAVPVLGFYSNSGATLTLTDPNAALNASRGIALKGVYFANNSKGYNDMYNTYTKSYTTANTYWVAANNGAITVTLNGDFVSNLMSRGVVGSGADEVIKVFPVYERKTVEVRFENVDREDSVAAKRGKYDAANLASHLANIVENVGNSGIAKAQYSGGQDYYKMSVPNGSVIRVLSRPISTRSANGISWTARNAGGTQTGSGVSYYRNGDVIANPLNPNGTRLTETDYTRAELTVLTDSAYVIKPNTGGQSFYVGYSPRSLASAKADRNITSTGSLAMAVLDITDGLPDSSALVSGANVTDANGTMELRNAQIGKQYSLMVNPPAGYYTNWANMTGDANKDGAITAAETTSQSNRSSSPRYVYGDRLFVTQDQDNMMYYYMFQPKTNSTSTTVTGSVQREYNTLLRLATSMPAMRMTPVAGAYVNVAGFTGMTNANGLFTIPLQGSVTDWGNVSMRVETQEGSSYSSVTALERYTNVNFPALEVFTAVPNNSRTQGVTASYNSSSNSGAVSPGFIMVKDDTLNVSVSVNHNAAYIATKAHFSVYDADGHKRFDCDGKDGYSVSTRNGNYLTATLSFNPKRDISAGDSLWVSFEDQNGTVYAPIDVGYQFAAELSLDQFIFPLLGSSTLEGVYRSLESIDIIGNPLGDLSVGTIPGFTVSSSTYRPVSNYDLSWMQTDYKYGWKTTFSKNGEFGDEGEKGDETIMDVLNTLKDVAENGIGDRIGGGSFSGSGSFNCSITPEIGFRVRISQRFTDQNRGNYFEDLVFYFKLAWDVSASITIATPIGINVLIDLGTDGDFIGVYHMFVDYPERFHEEGVQEWSSEAFNVFVNKPTSSRYLRREAYLFLNPGFTVGIGVNVWVVTAKCTAHFDFDMDFRFRSGGTDAYGDMSYKIGWSFEACGFTLYEYEMDDFDAIRLFNTPGTNGHITVDLESALNGSLTGARNASLKDAKPVSRDYMEYRGGWQQPGDQVSLMNAEGSEESELRDGAADNMNVNLLPIGGEGDLLMVYVDDGGATRANPNKRAVYYSVYTASSATWSEPQIIDDDGTPDEYPSARDLGNGQILVTWSSAEMAMPENATVEDMFTAMNLQAAFFDKDSRTFGDVTTLTETNEEDYTADIMPHAAYDPETGRVILYYTKTEFVDLDELTDISTAYSAVAYLFYQYDQNSDGTWAVTGAWHNTGDDYTEEELNDLRTERNLDEAGIEAYKTDWYGQRFLDTRLDKNSSTTPRVVDSSAIGYNGLALYAYTVDWDGSLDTSNDRDVFLQIYNFSENSFSHIIRVTQESGTYTLPQFARSNYSTYLFYGEKAEDNEHGAIRYLNVSYLIRNECYEKITNGSSEYYVLRTTTPEVEITSSDGSTTVLPEETTDVTGDIAAECSNLTDFDVFVSNDGRMYLVWDAADNEDGLEIYAAVLNTAHGPEEGMEEDGEDGGHGEGAEVAWSGAVALTDGGENVFYTGLGAIGYEGQILVVAGKQQALDGGEVHNSMIQVAHTPFSRAELDETLDVDNLYALAGDVVTVTAKLNNVGLDTIPASEEGIVIALQVNGEDAGEAVYRGSIPGGTSVDVTASVEVPDAEDVTITASYEGVTASRSLLKEAILSVENGAFGYATEAIETEEETIPEGTQIYSAEITNVGNIPSEDAVFTVKVGDTTIGSATVPAMEAGDWTQIFITLEIPDNVWQIDEDGMGNADAVVSAVVGDEEFFRDNQTLSKQFDAEAISLLSAYQSSGSVGDTDFTIPVGELAQVQPAITGVDGLTVEWLYSEDGSIASIDYSNGIYGQSPGTTTLHGILVPAREVVAFNENGEGSRTEWTTLIPEDLQAEVTATVTVQEAEEEPTPTPVATPTTAPTGTQPTTAPTGTQPTTAPTGTQPTTAPTGAPGTPTPTPTPVPAKQGCYVATCVYGSYDCPEVWTLRRLRDEVLADTWYGRLFIHAYYAVSPTVVKLFGNCDWFQNLCRAKLDQIVATLQAEGFESTPYNDPQW